MTYVWRQQLKKRRRQSWFAQSKSTRPATISFSSVNEKSEREEVLVNTICNKVGFLFGVFCSSDDESPWLVFFFPLFFLRLEPELPLLVPGLFCAVASAVGGVFVDIVGLLVTTDLGGVTGFTGTAEKSKRHDARQTKLTNSQPGNYQENWKMCGTLQTPQVVRWRGHSGPPGPTQGKQRFYQHQVYVFEMGESLWDDNDKDHDGVTKSHICCAFFTGSQVEHTKRESDDALSPHKLVKLLLHLPVSGSSVSLELASPLSS